MKIGTGNKVTPLATSGDDHEFRFDVDSAKAFSLLTKDLYTKIEMSIVRELFSNAVDAGADKIRIKVDSDQNVFEIKDNGCGMSKEKLLNVYTVLFKSDKNDTDAAVGGFGLGAKVPLAYNKQLMNIVTSDGTFKTTAVAWVDNGKPKLSILDCQYSSDNSGTVISFPIEDGNHRRFESAVRLFHLYNDDILEIDVTNCDERKDRGKVVHYDGFAIKSKKYDLYDLDVNILVNGRIPYSSQTLRYQSRNCPNLVMKVNISDVDINLSREVVDIDEKKADDILENVIKTIKELIYSDVVSRQEKLQLWSILKSNNHKTCPDFNDLFPEYGQIVDAIGRNRSGPEQLISFKGMHIKEIFSFYPSRHDLEIALDRPTKMTIVVDRESRKHETARSIARYINNGYVCKGKGGTKSDRQANIDRYLPGAVKLLEDFGFVVEVVEQTEESYKREVSNKQTQAENDSRLRIVKWDSYQNIDTIRPVKEQLQPKVKYVAVYVSSGKLFFDKECTHVTNISSVNQLCAVLRGINKVPRGGYVILRKGETLPKMSDDFSVTLFSDILLDYAKTVKPVLKMATSIEDTDHNYKNVIAIQDFWSKVVSHQAASDLFSKIKISKQTVELAAKVDEELAGLVTRPKTKISDITTRYFLVRTRYRELIMDSVGLTEKQLTDQVNSYLKEVIGQ